MRILSYILFLLLPIFGFGQKMQYSKAKVFLYEKTLQELSALGVEVDHGIHVPYRHIVNDYSQEELLIIKDAGFEVEILIEDVVAFYKTQNRNSDKEILPRGGACNSVELDSFSKYPYETPVNYQYGSMGGYLTYQEMLEELDKMRAMYPNLVSAKAPIGDFETVDGNRILWMRISNNPDVDQSKPEVFYNAVHHAREPNSLSQLVFYMWYLLENYATDDYVKFLVDNTEMYFVPCINPDGYIYNEQTDPQGGGLWRKNRRDNLNGSFGVDLNRNYGFFWGFDNQGSSPSTGNQTYRGESAFSEIETQAIRAFCIERDFKMVLNYHSFGNLLIHPWGYNDQPTEEDSIFKAFGNAMNIENDFVMGTGTETVGYIVNGDSDDWMYGEQTEKNKIYSYTPEVGSNANDGFWPEQNNIDYLNRSAMRLNLTTAHIAVDKLSVSETDATTSLTDRVGELYFDARMLGLLGGSYVLTLKSESDKIESISDPVNLNMQFFENAQVNFQYVLSEDVSAGEYIDFSLELNNGLYSETISLDKTYIGEASDFESIVEDNIANFDNWATNNWSLTQTDFISAPYSITDSEGLEYNPGTTNVIGYTQQIDLTDVLSAKASFWAKWAIEDNYDKVEFQVSENGANYIALCGNFTQDGSGDGVQEAGVPVYDGFQTEWVLEEIDLQDYVGKSIFVRFILESDNFVEFDGFYFDDFKIDVLEEGVSSIIDRTLEKEVVILPNPASSLLELSIAHTAVKLIKEYRILNNLGQLQLQDVVDSPREQINLDNLQSGVYYIEFLTHDNRRFSKKVIVQK